MDFFWKNKTLNHLGVAAILNQDEKQSFPTDILLDKLCRDAESKHTQMGVDTNNLDPSQMEKMY